VKKKNFVSFVENNSEKFMMSKEEHIAYWVNTAEKDWKAVKDLFETANYVQSLFFAHLVLEKLTKAIWVKNNEENTPPRTHLLLRILQEAQVSLNSEQEIFLQLMNNFQMQGRYPDYLQNIYRICTESYTQDIIHKVEELKLCLQEILQQS
jgi:HEPN domain-containing protein